jgi:hypothetical protein
LELLRYYVKALSEVRWLVFTDQPRHRINVLLLWAFESTNGTVAVMEVFKKLCAFAVQLKEQVRHNLLLKPKCLTIE